MKSKRARTVKAGKIKFKGVIIIPFSLNGITKKLKVFLLKNTEIILCLTSFRNLISGINQLIRFGKMKNALQPKL